VAEASLATPEQVLDFWFGLDPKQWWTKDDAFDAGVRKRFLSTYEAAAAGKLAAWEAAPERALALIIVLDQFSRNMFRGSLLAFAQDPLAREIVHAAIAAGDEGALPTVERTFLYMPLMHAEDMEMQRESLASFTKLRGEAPAELVSYVDNSIKFARMHADVIEQFGRFPHRNAILGRTSTPEEEAFLAKPGSSFG
jgi:uncharacterized protein (DUF924 family)